MILSPELRCPQDATPRTREMIADAWASCRRELRVALLDPAIRTVIAMVGIPGAGKSTYSRAIDGPDVVIFDAVWANPGRRAALARQIRAAGRRAVAVWVRTPLDECLQRQLSRPAWRRVPDSACRRAAVALHVQGPHVREGWNEVRIIDGSSRGGGT